MLRWVAEVEKLLVVIEVQRGLKGVWFAWTFSRIGLRDIALGGGGIVCFFPPGDGLNWRWMDVEVGVEAEEKSRC